MATAKDVIHPDDVFVAIGSHLNPDTKFDWDYCKMARFFYDRRDRQVLSGFYFQRLGGFFPESPTIRQSISNCFYAGIIRVNSDDANCFRFSDLALQIYRTRIDKNLTQNQINELEQLAKEFGEELRATK